MLVLRLALFSQAQQKITDWAVQIGVVRAILCHTLATPLLITLRVCSNIPCYLQCICVVPLQTHTE